MEQASESGTCRDAMASALRVAALASAVLLFAAAHSARAQALPDLDHAPTSFRAEDFVPAEMAEYAKRKWMWSLADVLGKKEQEGLPRLGDSKEKPSAQGWMLYGRAGILRWQNDLGEDDLSSFRFGLRHRDRKSVV